MGAEANEEVKAKNLKVMLVDLEDATITKTTFIVDIIIRLNEDFEY